MCDYELIGQVVRRKKPPTFSATFARHPDGGWHTVDVRFDEPPPPDAGLLARLMREAGDYFAANHRHDWLQAAIADEAKRQGVGAKNLAARTGLDESHIADYLSARKSMNSHKVQALVKALGGKVVFDVAG